jgi:DNA polymerase III subunit beta
MKLSILRQPALQALRTVCRPSKSHAIFGSVYNGVHVVARQIGTPLLLSGSEVNWGVAVWIHSDCVRETGDEYLPSSIMDWANLTSGDTIEISSAEKKVNLRSGKTRSEVNTLAEAARQALPIDEAEFPAEEFESIATASVNCKRLASAIRGTIFCVEKKISLSQSAGVRFDMQDGGLSLVACDGFRLAIAREAAVYSGQAEMSQFMLTPDVLVEVGLLAEQFDGEAVITLYKGKVRIDFDHPLPGLGSPVVATVIASTLSIEKFTDYAALIVDDASFGAVVLLDDLRSACRLAEIFASESHNRVRITGTKGQVLVQAISESGQTQDVIDALTSGDDGAEIYVKGPYVLQPLLAMMPDKIAQVHLSFTSGPLLIRPAGDMQDGRLYLAQRMIVK